jgi:hypothetical protein
MQKVVRVLGDVSIGIAYISRIVLIAEIGEAYSVAIQHVMITHQHMEAILTTKQKANRKQGGSKKHGTC